jgi:hypothetical protein
MKTHFKKFGFIFLMICCLGSNAKADIYDWTGAFNTSVTDGRNWAVLQPGGLVAICAGGIPGPSDDVRIGVDATYITPVVSIPPVCLIGGAVNITLTRLPVITTSVAWKSVTFGPLINGLSGISLTVNSPGALTVSGDITLAINNAGSANPNGNNYLLGTGGTITCNNIQLGAVGTTNSGNAILISRVTTLNVLNNVNIILSTTVPTGSGFRLEDGTMTLTNKINITNPNGINSTSTGVNNVGYFTIDARNSSLNNVNTTPILRLLSSAAISPLPAQSSAGVNLATINFNGTSTTAGDISVYYLAANPTIYTTSTPGFGTGGPTINSKPQYDNLYIQGTGTAIVNSGSLVTDEILNTNTPTTIDLSTQNPNVTVGTSWTNSSIVNGGTGTITVGTNLLNTGTISLSSGTTDVNGSVTNGSTTNATALLKMGSGPVTVAANYTNYAIFTAGTGLITFDGTTAQTLIDNTTAGTKFNNVTFSSGTTGATSKRMKSGSNFFVNPTYTLNVNGSGILTVENTPATYTSALTLISNSTGDASIGNLTAGSIAGKIEVQRYINGGARRYMLISSPVADTTNTTISATSNSYSLKPIILPGTAGSHLSTIVTGPTGSAAGFDNAPATGNSPSVYVYNENAPSSTSPSQVAGSEYKAFTNTSAAIPMGNGILLYFRGSRDMINTSTGAPFVSPYPAADNATLTFFGAVIKGTTATNSPMTPNIINLPLTTSADASTYPLAGTTYPTTLSSRSPAPSKKGYNLVGNPYASVIDLAKVGLLNPALKFYYLLIKNAATGSNSSSTRFVLCNTTNATPAIGTGGSQYVLSGQGFFVVASTTGTSIKFDEGVKVPYTTYTGTTPAIFNVKKGGPSVVKTLSVNGNKNVNIEQTAATEALTATTPASNPLPWLRLDMAQDSSTFSTTDIYFDKNAQNNFVPGEDAPYLASSGQGNFFFSQTADSVGCFANYTTSLEKLKKINLFVAFSTFGTYKLTSPVKQGIDDRYTIYLKDKFTGDSLDVVHNSTYTFNVTATPASYARDRFYLSIGIAPGHEYKLLGFSGSKVTSGIQLTWKTDNESSFTMFFLEKSTNNGISFSSIDSLQSSGQGSYTYTDMAPDKGQIIYRLRQRLATGVTNLSNNLTFSYLNENPIKFIVYPSTASQSININLGKTYSNNIKVNIVSATGALVKTINTSNTDSLQQNVGGLLKGLYIVEAIDEATGKKIGSAKFLKQ